MSTKYYVKPAAQPIATSRTKPSSTPPASGLRPRNTVNNRAPAPARPLSDPPTQDKEPANMNVRSPTSTGTGSRGGATRGGTTATAGGEKPRGAPQVTRAGTTATTGGAQPRGAPPTRGPAGMRAPVGPSSGPRSDLVPCKTCNRSFAPDRVQAHAEICSKTARKKRKPFDVAKQRVKGTELEQFTRKGRSSAAPPPSLLKSNWRRKHEEFINNIRAAKQAQQHVAKGGKLSDLPPPPPLDTSDYIQCPHCGRKFNQQAAERHIPKCATMLHNKPNPNAGGRPTAGGGKPKTTQAQTRRY